MADLNSGKKVLVVAHSQGAFYANNAYRYIAMNIPEYKESMGIVSVAPPATWVDGGGQYNINDVYTTDPNDIIINMVRSFYGDTLLPNVAAPVNPATDTSHEFVNSYLFQFSGRIKNQILRRVDNLNVPEKDLDCKTPSEVPVMVKTGQGSDITRTSARLHGEVISGKQIGLAFKIRPASNSPLPSCEEYINDIPETGHWDTGELYFADVENLFPDTEYIYQLCGREGDRVDSGGVLTFTTPPPIQECDSTYTKSGGFLGLDVDYDMGTEGANATVLFETYDIPDKLEIWHGGVLIYSTTKVTSDGYISTNGTPLKARICHEPSRGSLWNIKVYGNEDDGTAWDLSVACPHAESVFETCPTLDY